jgi:threonine/homoserine/homoserine lactone efflux protein
VNDFPLAALVGVIAGFLGAIPPGPLNVTIARKTLHGLRRDAFRVALGGAAIDAFICGLIGLGFGWLLDRLSTNRWVRVSLAVFLVVYGLKILFRDVKQGGAREALQDDSGSPPAAATPPPPSAGRFRLPVLTGLLQGAANPALIVNWTLLLSFLVGHRLLATGASPAAGFALGVGIGVFAWFAVLIELLEKLKGRAAGGWVKWTTVLAGVLLVVFGLVFTYRSFTGR